MMTRHARFLCFLMMITALCFCVSFADSLENGEAVPVDFSTLQPGDSSDAVRNLQTRLMDIGYLTDVTGTYDEDTGAAVLKVQENYGLDTTGIANDETQEVIFGSCYLPLKQGMEGKQVRAMQEALKSKSLYSDALNGVYGLTTVQAVKLFQQLYSLEPTGEADIETLTLLNQDLSDREILAGPTATPAPVITVYEEKVKYQGKLAYGAKNARVQQVQERLKELGFFTYKKTTTGFYKNTLQAVKDFQKQNGLPVSGIVDETTWNALFNDVGVVPVSGTPRPSPEPTPVPYAMDVDVRNQVVKVYTYDSSKEYNVLVRVMICSTGTSSHPSKPGTYVLSGRKARWCTFPKWGGGTAQYWTKIDNDIAFHSIMYINYDPDRPNMKTFNNLGRRASHGCIRLHVTDAKWVYDNITAGTVLTIHNDGNTDRELAAFAGYRKTNAQNTVMSASSYSFSDPAPAFKSQRSGSYGTVVFWMQKTLEQLGYFKDTTATGYYGPMTVSAVKRFQKAYKINANGVLNEKTYNKLVELQQQELSKTKAGN